MTAYELNEQELGQVAGGAPIIVYAAPITFDLRETYAMPVVRARPIVLDLRDPTVVRAAPIVIDIRPRKRKGGR
ncbi:hypothetical protein [Microvirga thermotolerans]|uniref:Uncharacterized protein n=1 Tax=Microvirga thermotolerans TaxID=2651334 RepID=A0A5P9K0K8_9HYPH|nr:hypothetical protein [Microvirga thermotolerans]QFU17941.1 hypothetical protein GDR74_17930 [Microvirga thermotolerans]